MGVFYGLMTAVCFGTADFSVTLASRRIGALRALYFIQVVGVIALVALAIVKGDGPPAWSLTWVLMGILGVVAFAGIYLLYRAFSIGTLSIVSPIAAGYAVVTGLLALSFGERPPGLVLVGVAVLVVGVMVFARGSGGGAATLDGVPEALLAALFLGIFFWGVDGVSEEWGWLWPVIVNRVVQLICAILVLACTNAGLSLRQETGTARLLIAAALLDTGALVSFNLGLEQSYATSTTALSSLYSAVAVVLAWFFLKERLAPEQWSGIATILVGVLLVSL